MADFHEPVINKNLARNLKRKAEKVADLVEQDRRRIELYHIYGKQEPGPLDKPPVRIVRGRVDG